MKVALTQAVLFVVLALAADAQTNRFVPPPVAGKALPDWRAWTVTARDGGSTTRQFAEPLTNRQTGKVTPQTHTLVQVATGLNYLSAAGVWRESRDAIQLTPDGGAAAVQGPLKVAFAAAGLNDDAAVSITTTGLQVLKARVLGVYCFDSQSGQSRLLAAPADGAVAELHPPNQIVYKGAFHSGVLEGDLRYTCTKAGFRCEVIITHQPKLGPVDCGFNPDTAFLQVRHQWRDAPAPRRVRAATLGQGAQAQPADTLIDLGEVWFSCGRACLTDGASRTDTNVAAPISLAGPVSNSSGIPVANQWREAGFAGGPSTLTESVAWDNIAPQLARLPRIAQTGDSAATNPAPAAKKRAIQSGGTPVQGPALVLDYVLLASGNPQNYTFQSYSPDLGPTYLVDGEVGQVLSSGTLTFQPGCVIKYAHNGMVSCIQADCQGTAATPSILTSEYDGQYGDVISTTNLPAIDDVGYAINLLNPGTNLTLNGLCIRYANVGIYTCDMTCGVVTQTLANCVIYQSNTGVGSWGDNLRIENSTCYLVPTPVWQYCSSASGGFIQGGPPVLTVNPACQVLEQGAEAVFAAAISPPGPATYQWYIYACQSEPGGGLACSWQRIAGATSPAYTLASPTNGTQLAVYAWNPFGAASIVGSSLYVNALDSYGWAIWNSLVSEASTKSAGLWTTVPIANPPAGMAWNPNSLIYGMEGFTAISQMNTRDLPPCDGTGCPGVESVTALTLRHGYMRGHGEGITNGFNTSLPGETVWFCTADNPPNNLVTATVLNAYTRCYGPYDYTVLLFDRDLPPGISPMQVANPPPGGGVFLATSQKYIGSVAGRVTVLSPNCLNDTALLPAPFEAGDSGSPAMWVTANNSLVFIGGITTSGPSPQMQADMNSLVAAANLNLGLNLDTNNYQMTWYTGQ